MADSPRKLQSSNGKKSKNQPNPESMGIFPGRITRRSRFSSLQLHLSTDCEVVPAQPQPNPAVHIPTVSLAELPEIHQFNKPNVAADSERPEGPQQQPIPSVSSKLHRKTRLRNLNSPDDSNKSDESEKEYLLPTQPEPVPSVHLGAASPRPQKFPWLYETNLSDEFEVLDDLGAIPKDPRRVPWLHHTNSPDNFEETDESDKEYIPPTGSAPVVPPLYLGAIPKDPWKKPWLDQTNSQNDSEEADESAKEYIQPTGPVLALPSLITDESPREYILPEPASVIPSVSLGAIPKVPRKAPRFHNIYSSDDSDMSDQSEQKYISPSPSTSSGAIQQMPGQPYEPEPSEPMPSDNLRVIPKPRRKTLPLRKACSPSLSLLPVPRSSPYLLYPDTRKSTGCLARNIRDQFRYGGKKKVLVPKTAFDTASSHKEVESSTVLPYYMLPSTSRAYPSIDEGAGIPSMSSSKEGGTSTVLPKYMLPSTSKAYSSVDEAASIPSTSSSKQGGTSTVLPEYMLPSTSKSYSSIDEAPSIPSTFSSMGSVPSLSTMQLSASYNYKDDGTVSREDTSEEEGYF